MADRRKLKSGSDVKKHHEGNSLDYDLLLSIKALLIACLQRMFELENVAEKNCYDIGQLKLEITKMVGRDINKDTLA